MDFTYLLQKKSIYAATGSHAPILKRNSDTFIVKAVWSRSIKSAQQLAITLDCAAFSGEDELEALINDERNDIDAFIVALPLDVQPNVVIRLLKAGKHVLSEKPIGPTVEVAKQLIAEYNTLNIEKNNIIWSVAENFRYEQGIRKAAQLVKENEIGDIIMMNLTVKNPFQRDNPYLNTEWRNKPSWYGGFFVDAFVHAVAGVRSIIPYDVERVSAITSHRADYLPAPDTMVATVKWKNDIMGSISASYAADTFKYEFEVTGKGGTLVLQRSTTRAGYNLIITKGLGKSRTVQEEFFHFDGLDQEFLAFARSCTGGDRRDDNTPTEALKDLEFVEALLKSGKQNGSIVTL